MAINTIFPSIGPAKSTWMRAHGRVGQCHGWRGDAGGDGRTCWHWLQVFTRRSMSWSMFGHQTNIQAKVFILDDPGCPPWSSVNTSWRPASGIKTRLPQRIQSSNNDSSHLFDQYACNSGVACDGHPSLIHLSTCANTGSLRVHLLIWLAVTGESFKCSMSKTCSARQGTDEGFSDRGSRLSASAFPWWWVERHSRSYSYMASFRAHRCIRPEAWMLAIEQRLQRFVVRYEGEVSSVYIRVEPCHAEHAGKAFLLDLRILLFRVGQCARNKSVLHLAFDVKAQHPHHMLRHHMLWPVPDWDHSVPTLQVGVSQGPAIHMGSAPSWCVCGNCREMGNATENICCQKVNCVTHYEEFFALCVNHMVGILDNADTRADPVDYSPAKYRKIAYRHYILWN